MFDNRLRSLAGLPPIEEKDSYNEQEESPLDIKQVCKDIKKCIRFLKKKCASCKSSRLKEIYEKDIDDFCDLCELLEHGRVNKACEIWNQMDSDSKEMLYKNCGDCVHEFFDEIQDCEDDENKVDENKVDESVIISEVDDATEFEVEIDQVDFNQTPEPNDFTDSPKVDIPSEVMKDLEDQMKEIETHCRHYEMAGDKENVEYCDKVHNVLMTIKNHFDEATEYEYSQAVIFVHGLLNTTYHRFIPFSVKKFLCFYPTGKSLQQFMDEKKDSE